MHLYEWHQLLLHWVNSNPVLIFAKLKSGMSPEINAIATVALILTAVIGVWAERFTRRMNKDS